MTRSRLGRSMPRAATSVATQMRARPSRIACSALVRSAWLSSPDSATTEKPRLASRLARCLTASRVAQKTSAFCASKNSSELMMAFSRSDGATRMVRYSMSPCWSLSPAAVMRSASRWKRFGEQRDGFRHGGGEHQRAAVGRGGGEDEFEILAKTEVEHLVGLVEHDGAQLRNIERAARDVVAQPAGRADDDMRALFQRSALLAHVHAADAGAEARAGFLVEPFEFAVDLHREFACRRDDQRAGRAGAVEALGAAKQRRRNRDAEGDGLARAGLGRDQQVGAIGFGRQHRGLHGGQRVVATRCERSGQCRNHFCENRHECSFIGAVGRR